MNKRRLISALWLLAGFAIGALLTLLCWFGVEKAEEAERYKECKNRDYSFIRLPDALDVRQNELGGTEYIFSDTTVLLESEETISIFDTWSGQIRQYHNGVLFLLLVADYGSSLGPDYRQYQIRSLEECKALSQLLQAGNMEELKAEGGRIWQMESGEMFVD